MSKRKPHGFAVSVPHIADGKRQYSMLSTNDTVCRRRVKRVLRQWVRHYLERTLHPIELAALMKTVKYHDEPMVYFFHKQSNPVPENTDAPTDG